MGFTRVAVGVLGLVGVLAGCRSRSIEPSPSRTFSVSASETGEQTLGDMPAETPEQTANSSEQTADTPPGSTPNGVQELDTPDAGGSEVSQVEPVCPESGECVSDEPCSEEPRPQGTTCGTEGAGECDGAGVCLVPDKASLGEGCSVGADCAEGNCLEGPDGSNLCCDSSCDGVCSACGADGRCNATPEDDENCPSQLCPADNVCRDYPPEVRSCVEFGVCAGTETCIAEAQALRPDSQCSCGAEGDCKLNDGVSCQGDVDCGNSSACERTFTGTFVCCAETCQGGDLCSADGSQCIECEGAGVSCLRDIEQRCQAGTIVQSQCENGCTSGVGCNANAPIGFPCNQSNCQVGGVCQQDTSGQQRCCVRNCGAEGKQCAQDGSCQCPAGQIDTGNSCLRQLGDPCTANNQCQGNQCVDGVCCSEACGEFCEQCQQFSGQCVAVGAGQQDDTCNNTHECTGQRNDCRARVGESCTADSGCVTNTCSATAGGGASICCAQNCGGQTPFCRANGQGCVQCETDSDCASGAQCSFQGTCECSPNLVPQPNGSCIAPTQDDGAACVSFAECQSQQCIAHYIDTDGDGFAPRGATESRFCASNGFTRNGFTRTTPANSASIDCLDSDRNTRPNQNAFFPQPRGDGSFDYDCDGVVEKDIRTVITDDICFANQGGACDAEGILADSDCGETMVSGFCVRMGPATCSLGRSGNAIGPRECH